MKGLKSTLMAATAALLLGLGSAAEATSITGEIHISNLALQTPVNVLSTDEINFANNAAGTVSIATGDFAPVLNESATIADIPSLSLFSGISPFWTVAIPGLTFTFDLSSIETPERIDGKNADFLNVSGAGIMKGTTFTDTPYFWSLTATQTGATVSVTTSHSPVPEPTSLLLLGAGLAGLGIVRRKIARG